MWLSAELVGEAERGTQGLDSQSQAWRCPKEVSGRSRATAVGIRSCRDGTLLDGSCGLPATTWRGQGVRKQALVDRASRESESIGRSAEPRWLGRSELRL